MDHHTSLEPSDDDKALGDRIAYEIGDTFLDCYNQSPAVQWAEIVKILRLYGREICIKK